MNNPADVHRTSRTSLQFHHNNRHNVSHPIPKHTDKSQHRTPHHNPRTPKKKPEGCAEGPWLYGPFAVFLSFPKKKTQPLAKEEKHTLQNKHNKNRNKKEIKEKKHEKSGTVFRHHSSRRRPRRLRSITGMRPLRAQHSHVHSQRRQHRPYALQPQCRRQLQRASRP